VESWGRGILGPRSSSVTVQVLPHLVSQCPEPGMGTVLCQPGLWWQMWVGKRHQSARDNLRRSKQGPEDTSQLRTEE
jgi:hypothetical protein